jgi:nicotinate-nucleotide adenylyltransferase
VNTGLFFGSFNPIHLGHLALAGYMTEFEGLDQLWFVISPHNPLKKKETLLDDSQRLHMARLAAGDNLKLRASDIEFRLPVPSYTIDTLAYLEEKHSGNNYHLVMGEDNLYTLHKWKNAAQLVKKYPILVYPRHGCQKPSNEGLNHILDMADVRFSKAPLIEISGTFIRDGINKGKDMSYYLPQVVWKYIDEMNFYRSKR